MAHPLFKYGVQYCCPQSQQNMNKAEEFQRGTMRITEKARKYLMDYSTLNFKETWLDHSPQVWKTLEMDKAAHARLLAAYWRVFQLTLICSLLQNFHLLWVPVESPQIWQWVFRMATEGLNLIQMLELEAKQHEDIHFEALD